VGRKEKCPSGFSLLSLTKRFGLDSFPPPPFFPPLPPSPDEPEVHSGVLCVAIFLRGISFFRQDPQSRPPEAPEVFFGGHCKAHFPSVDRFRTLQAFPLFFSYLAPPRAFRAQPGSSPGRLMCGKTSSPPPSRIWPCPCSGVCMLFFFPSSTLLRQRLGRRFTRDPGCQEQSDAVSLPPLSLSHYGFNFGAVVLFIPAFPLLFYKT